MSNSGTALITGLRACVDDALATVLRGARRPGAAQRRLGATVGPLGQGWARRGPHILGRGRVVVTDKLRGRVLALLAGLPHVVPDNGYGKVSGVHESWTHPSTLAHRADTGDEARALAVAKFGPETGNCGKFSSLAR